MPRNSFQPYKINVTYAIDAKDMDAAERCAENITKHNTAMVVGGDYIWEAKKGAVQSVKAARLA